MVLHLQKTLTTRRGTRSDVTVEDCDWSAQRVCRVESLFRAPAKKTFVQSVRRLSKNRESAFPARSSSVGRTSVVNSSALNWFSAPKAAQTSSPARQFFVVATFDTQNQ